MKRIPQKKRNVNNLNLILHEILKENGSIAFEQSTKSLSPPSNSLETLYNTHRTHDLRVYTPMIGYSSNHYENLLSLSVPYKSSPLESCYPSHFQCRALVQRKFTLTVSLHFTRSPSYLIVLVPFIRRSTHIIIVHSHIE